MTILGLATGARLHPRDDIWFDRLATARCPAIRLASPWDQIEPHVGDPYDWSWPDLLVAQCEKYGLELALGLKVRDAYTYATPEKAQAWVECFAAQVERYAGNPVVVGFESINEPNHLKTDPVPSAANYTNLILKPCHDLAKPHAPDKPLMLGGLGGAKNDANDGDSVTFLDECYRLGAKDHFDVLAFHPYSRGSLSWAVALLDPKQGAWRLRQARQLMKANGDKAKQIWTTENGWPTGGNRNAVSPARQADLLRQWVVWSRSKPWLGPLFWFDHADDPTADPNNQGDWMGLWDSASKPKPSLAAFTALQI